MYSFKNGSLDLCNCACNLLEPLDKINERESQCTEASYCHIIAALGGSKKVNWGTCGLRSLQVGLWWTPLNWNEMLESDNQIIFLPAHILELLQWQFKLPFLSTKAKICIGEIGNFGKIFFSFLAQWDAYFEWIPIKRLGEHCIYMYNHIKSAHLQSFIHVQVCVGNR